MTTQTRDRVGTSLAPRVVHAGAARPRALMLWWSESLSPEVIVEPRSGYAGWPGTVTVINLKLRLRRPRIISR